METFDGLERYAHIFTGRIDAYGSDTGGAVWSPVLPITYERHLLGIEPIGIYPVQYRGEESKVRWGCCDIDTGDWREAYMLAIALQGMKMRPFVERSRSKGWHIWVFVDTWVPARVMRRALKVAYASIDLPAKEANPKSEQLRPDQLGNYVRLPYKGALVTPNERQCMMETWGPTSDGTPMLLADFLGLSDDQLFTPVNIVEYWASKWYEPPRRTANVTLDDSVDYMRLAASLPVTWRKVWLDGDVRDRSATFVAMAYDLAKRGWQAQQVFDVLWGCPWNKYRDRNNGDHYVQDIVERAFS